MVLNRFIVRIDFNVIAMHNMAAGSVCGVVTMKVSTAVLALYGIFLCISISLMILSIFQWINHFCLVSLTDHYGIKTASISDITVCSC